MAAVEALTRNLAVLLASLFILGYVAGNLYTRTTYEPVRVCHGGCEQDCDEHEETR